MPDSALATSAMANVRFKTSPLFNATLEKFSRNPLVLDKLSEFQKQKAENPVQPFGAKDRMFQGKGNLSGYRHAGLTHDIQIIYKQEGANPTVIKLYMLATHDDVGTGQPANLKRQKQARKKLDRQAFEATNMKTADVIKESIEWNNPDHEWYMSLQGMINRNNGLFKSPKQASFILNRWAGDVVDGPESERYAKNFGTPIESGNRVVQTTGYYRWADYGARSIIPFLYVFELDDYGVVRKWKVGYRGNMRDGAAPDPKKAKLEFTRPEGLDTSHLIVQKSDTEKKAEFYKAMGGSTGKYVGEEGTRHDFGPVTLKKTIDLGYRDAGPYGSAQTWMNIYHDADGNIIYHTTTTAPHMKEGEVMNMVARIKKHMVNKRQEKVTIVNRPKFTA